MAVGSREKALNQFALVVILAIAFAYIEAAVVVYLRAIFHPAGFDFPLADVAAGLFKSDLLLIEIGREAATLGPSGSPATEMGSGALRVRTWRYVWVGIAGVVDGHGAGDGRARAGGRRSVRKPKGAGCGSAGAST